MNFVEIKIKKTLSQTIEVIATFGIVERQYDQGTCAMGYFTTDQIVIQWLQSFLLTQAVEDTSHVPGCIHKRTVQIKEDCINQCVSLRKVFQNTSGN